MATPTPTTPVATRATVAATTETTTTTTTTTETATTTTTTSALHQRALSRWTECPVCDDEFRSGTARLLPCLHTVCRLCEADLLEDATALPPPGNVPQCPVCYETFAPADVVPNYVVEAAIVHSHVHVHDLDDTYDVDAVTTSLPAVASGAVGVTAGGGAPSFNYDGATGSSSSNNNYHYYDSGGTDINGADDIFSFSRHRQRQRLQEEATADAVDASSPYFGLGSVAAAALPPSPKAQGQTWRIHLSERPATAATPTCIDHPRLALTMYCEQCERSVCAQCFEGGSVAGHADHSLLELDLASANLARALEPLLAVLQRQADELALAITKIDQRMNEIKARVTMLREDVTEGFAEAAQLLRKHIDDLQQHLQDEENCDNSGRPDDQTAAGDSTMSGGPNRSTLITASSTSSGRTNGAGNSLLGGLQRIWSSIVSLTSASVNLVSYSSPSSAPSTAMQSNTLALASASTDTASIKSASSLAPPLGPSVPADIRGSEPPSGAATPRTLSRPSSRRSSHHGTSLFLASASGGATTITRIPAAPRFPFAHPRVPLSRPDSRTDLRRYGNAGWLVSDSDSDQTSVTEHNGPPPNYDQAGGGFYMDGDNASTTDADEQIVLTASNTTSAPLSPNVAPLPESTSRERRRSRAESMTTVIGELQRRVYQLGGRRDAVITDAQVALAANNKTLLLQHDQLIVMLEKMRNALVQVRRLLDCSFSVPHAARIGARALALTFIRRLVSSYPFDTPLVEDDLRFCRPPQLSATDSLRVPIHRLGKLYRVRDFSTISLPTQVIQLRELGVVRPGGVTASLSENLLVVTGQMMPIPDEQDGPAENAAAAATAAATTTTQPPLETAGDGEGGGGCAFVMDLRDGVRKYLLAGFKRPTGVDILVNGDICVADREDNLLRIFSAKTGTIVRTIACERPIGVAGLLTGEIVVTQSDALVSSFGVDGVLRWSSKVGGAEHMFYGSHVGGVTISLVTGELVMADAANSRLKILSASTGQLLRHIASGQVEWPIGVACTLSGHIAVAETFGSRVSVWTMTGERVHVWGTHGDQPGQFNRPVGIDVLPDGHIVVVDHVNDRLQIF